MMASIPCSRIRRATRAWSPLSPVISGTPSATAQGEAGREIVEDDNALAGVAELKHHVAADITGSAGDQYRHLFRPCFFARGFPPTPI